MFWCAGMFASGSTWTFNMLRGVAGELYPGRAVAGRFVGGAHDLAGLDDPAPVHVVKSHGLPDGPAEALRQRARGIVVTLRDPRDAVTSLILYQRFPFAMALAATVGSARFCETLPAMRLRYEDGFPDRPDTVDRLARMMGGTLAPAQRDAVFATGRRAAVEALIGELPGQASAVRDLQSGDVFDPATQWHLHHRGRSGEIGRWRWMLSEAQIRRVEAELGDWMERFSYPPAGRKAAPAPSASGSPSRPAGHPRA